MRLTSYHLEDLRAVRRGVILLTSAGFVEFDGQPLKDPERERLDALWMGDYIDADIKDANSPAVVTLTAAGEQELARAEQESQR